MTPLPFTHGGARIAFYAAFVTFVLLEFRVRLRSFRNEGGIKEDRKSRMLVYLSISIGMVGGFVLARERSTSIRQARVPLFVAGVVLMTSGIALRQWAVALLGELFTTDVRVRAGQRVVTTGPYRWLRHPSYTGLLIVFVGIGLALGNWAALIVLVGLPTVGIVYRIRIEEGALLAALGDPYRRFLATRSRLIPRVW